jgi:hypothetical protein
MPTPKFGDVVSVLWLDACVVSEWGPIADHKGTLGSPVASVGIVLRCDKKVLTIAGSVDNANEACDVTSIPRSLVKLVSILKKAG